MRKINLAAILALLVSFNVNAAGETDLNAAISKSMGNPNSRNQSPAIVYGGKDILHSIVATSHEVTWSKQPVLVG